MVEKIRGVINHREIRETWQKLTKTDHVNVNEFERLASLVGGTGLVLYGLSRYSLKGVGWACVGGYLIYRGLTGYCPAFKAAHISTASQIKPPQIKAGNQARYQSQQQKPVDPAIENDGLIDEVALQSFPASDPPAWTTSRA
jgi:hypothetical protein